MQDKAARQAVVWIAGGNGFVGHEIAYQLQKENLPVYLLSRIAATHTDFNIIETDYSSENLALRFNPGDTVINLIGILNEKGFNGKGFEKAHVATTKAIVEACTQSGTRRYLHMSALHANERGPSHYLITKAKAQDIVKASSLDYTIFRPSVIFGAHDSFSNRFAQLLRLSPYFFPLACPRSRFQPVYVKDVAMSFQQSLDLPETIGKSYDLCGPEIFELKQIVELIAKTMNKKRKIIALSQSLSKLQARVLQFVPGKPFTMDNYKSLLIDSVCTSKQALPFKLSGTRLSEAMEEYL